jgi:ferredoxin-fold anticodon binding domain-containing protein
VYDSELGRDLINHVIELLKKIVSVISDGYQKPDRHEHEYKFLLSGMVGYGRERILVATANMTGNGYLQYLILIRSVAIPRI